MGLGGGQLVLRKQIEDKQKRTESSPVSLLYWLQYSCRHRPGCRSCELWKVSPAAPPSGHSTAPRSSGRLESKRDNFTAVVLKGFFPSTIFRALFFTPRLTLIMTLTRRLQRCNITQLPESGHQVDKCGHAHAVLLRQVSFKVVAQGEQVVSQVHAVVVLDGSQVRELEQVLPGQRRRASLNIKNLTGGGWAGG